MTPAEFLRTIWPEEGFFCLATPWVTPEGKSTYRHRVFGSPGEAIREARKLAAHADLFFCIHSLRAEKVWNPVKPDRKTGELGAFEVRTQANALQSRAFFLDLDVGESTTRASKYDTQHSALLGVQRFCIETKLPKPVLTSSGGGVHVYWPLSSALPSEEWKTHAAKLKHLARHHGLLADPARTTDTASVLRVVGSFNWKDRSEPRPVRVLLEGKATPTDEFLSRLDKAVIRAGVDVRPPPPLRIESDLGSNLDDVFSGPPVSIKAVLTACAQMRQLAVKGGNVSEPEWYHSLNLVRFAENGEKLVHRFSEKHPSYDRDATDAKVAQLQAKGIKPTTCLKLAEVCGEEACSGCPFAGKVKNPLMAARFRDPAPAPVVVQQIGHTIIETEVPPPPRPFSRLKSGGISVSTKNAQGDAIDMVIYPHDLYPLRRLVNTQSETEQQLWRVVLPRQGAKDFIIDADALYDRRKFLVTITNHGIYPSPHHIQAVQEYMVAYIAELQKLADHEVQCNHLGWTDEQTKFILPDRVLYPDGTARPAMLSLGATRASTAVHKKGTLERQVELLRFYNHPNYIANQFFILGSLASPIFLATGHHGVLVNASGEAGSSKSTSLYTAASFWGQPELYPVNGTNNGATVKGRNERVQVLANLPVCVDEITHMPVRDAVDLAMSISQPGHRIRLETSGVERSGPGSYKATMMLTTANSSLHNILSVDNAAGTAGSMRVFEIAFAPANVHTKPEADDYLHDLKQNFGHIGEAFVSYVVRNREAVDRRVRELMREVDTVVKIQAAERFWSATIAAVIAAAEISQSLGLLSFDPRALMTWALEKQVPFMRGVVVDEYQTPLGVMADYLEKINDHILVTTTSTFGGDQVIRPPRGEMLAHYMLNTRTMWVLQKGFKDYCMKIGANSQKMLVELSRSQPDAEGMPRRVVMIRGYRKLLGAHTDWAKAQSTCFSIDMSHPDVAGVVEVEEGPQVTKPIAAGTATIFRAIKGGKDA